MGLLPLIGMGFHKVVQADKPQDVPRYWKGRITHASQLRRGMVVTLHYPQTRAGCPPHSRCFVMEGAVVSEVFGDRVYTVRATGVPGCHKHHNTGWFFSDKQIISDEVPTLREGACNWIEVTGQVSEEEVQAMLSDDCLHVR
jgi:hypothetical protein